MKADVPRPIGTRFTFAYFERGQPLESNARLQRRVAEFFYTNIWEVAEAVLGDLLSELGAEIPRGHPAFSVRAWLVSASTNDFLDALTVIHRCLQSDTRVGNSRYLKAWVEFIPRALVEENSAFEVDSQGGVHPRIDAAYTSAATAAVAGLGAARYRTALDHFKQARSSLDERPAATARAIREMFMANEDLFKLMEPGASRLDVTDINKLLKKRVAATTTGPELNALNLMLTASGNYVSASHQYRHAQGQPEPAPPTMETAVLMLSVGTALLRWLVHLDQADQIAKGRTAET